jgi:hypothetical protein
MAGIGFGMQGPSNMQAFLEKDEVQWVAVCDLDDKHLATAQGLVNRKYGNTSCATYKDYRKLFARRDLGVMTGIPIPGLPRATLGLRGPVGRAFGDQLPQALAWGVSKKLKVVQRADNAVLPYWMVKQD